VRGEDHYGAVPLGSAWFGCRSRFTELGMQTVREPICSELLEKLQQAYEALILE